MCISTTRSFLTMEGKLASAICGCQSDVGNWLLAVGPTFIFPTATESRLGQNGWHGGPTAALGYAGRTYGSHLPCRHSSDGQFSELSLSRLNAMGPAWRRHNVLELRIDEQTNTSIT